MIDADWQRKAGEGTHATLSRFDMHNTLIAAGPDFRRGEIVDLPSGNVDLAPTILRILGITSPQQIDGRILSEAMTPPASLREAAAGRAFRNSSVSQLSTINSVKERGSPAVARDKVPRTARSRGKSSRKITRLHLWKRVWIATQLCLCLIEQLAQIRARSFVPEKPFPLRVADQFRKQRRNASQQFVPFRRRQSADRLLDLTRSAHQCLRYSGRPHR